MSGTVSEGWLPDPTGQHEFRFHDGSAFTSHVADHGVVTTDAGIPAPPAWSGQPAVGAPGAAAGQSVGGYPAAPPADPWAATAWPAPYAQAGPGFGTTPWGWSPTPVPQPKSSRHRGALWLAVVVAAVEAVVIVALAVALGSSKTGAPTAAGGQPSKPQPLGHTVAAAGSYPSGTGTVVFSSSFAPTDGWSVGPLNSNTDLSLSNGHYVMSGSSDVHHLAFFPYQMAQRGLSVEAEVTGLSANGSAGVGCQSDTGVQPPLVYQVSVFPDGHWYIEEGRLGGAVDTLLSGQATALGPSGSIQLTCVITAPSGSGETTQLVLYVNGTKVGAIGDDIGSTSLDGYVPVLLLGSYGAKASVTFTQVTVRSIEAPTST